MTPREWLDYALKAWPIVLFLGTGFVGFVRWCFWAHGRLKSVERMERAVPWLVTQLRETADASRRACFATNIQAEQLNLVTDMLYDAETGAKGARHQGTLELTDRQAVEALRNLIRRGSR